MHTLIHNKAAKIRCHELQYSRTNWRVNINVKFHRCMQFVPFWLRLRGIYQNNRRLYQTVVEDSTFFSTLSFASPCHVLLLVIPLIYHLMHAKFIAWKWWFDHHRKSHFGVSEFYSWAAVPSTCWISTTSFYRCIFSLVSLLCSFFLLVLGHSVTKRKRMNFNLDVSKHASDNVETLSYALPSFFLHMRFLLLFYCMMFLIRSDVNPWHCWNVYVFARTSSHFHKILFGWITYPHLPI